MWPCVLVVRILVVTWWRCPRVVGRKLVLCGPGAAQCGSFVTNRCVVLTRFPMVLCIVLWAMLRVLVILLRVCCLATSGWALSSSVMRVVVTVRPNPDGVLWLCGGALLTWLVRRCSKTLIVFCLLVANCLLLLTCPVRM